MINNSLFVFIVVLSISSGCCEQFITSIDIHCIKFIRFLLLNLPLWSLFRTFPSSRHRDERRCNGSMVVYFQGEDLLPTIDILHEVMGLLAWDVRESVRHASICGTNWKSPWTRWNFGVPSMENGEINTSESKPSNEHMKALKGDCESKLITKAWLEEYL